MVLGVVFMEKLYESRVLEINTETGIPKIEFRYDKVFNGKRTVIVRHFNHDKKNVNWDYNVKTMLHEIGKS